MSLRGFARLCDRLDNTAPTRARQALLREWFASPAVPPASKAWSLRLLSRLGKLPRLVSEEETEPTTSEAPR